MQRWLRLLPLLCVLSSTPLAHAQGLSLTWQAPAACPNASLMRTRVTQLVSSAAIAAQPLEAVGRIEHRDGRWRLNLELEVRGRHATRELQDSDCASLAEAAAWLISVAIDPHLAPPANVDAAVARDESAASTPKAPAADTAKPPAEAATPAKTDLSAEAPADDREEEDTSASAPAARPLHFRGDVFGGAFAGGPAGVAASAGLEAGVEIGQLSIALLGAHHFKRSRALSAPGTRVDFSSLEFGLTGCFQWGDRLRIGPCALVSVLRTAGSTHGVTDGENAAFVWATAGASINARYLVISPLELSLDGGLWVPISARPRFEIENLEASEPAGIGGRVRFGVGVRLP